MTTKTEPDLLPAERPATTNAPAIDERPLFDASPDGRNIPAGFALRLLGYLSLALLVLTSTGIILSGAAFWLVNCGDGQCNQSDALLYGLFAVVYAVSGATLFGVSVVSCRMLVAPRRRGEYWPAASVAISYALIGGALSPILSAPAFSRVFGALPGASFLLCALLFAVLALLIRRERPARAAIAGKRAD